MGWLCQADGCWGDGEGVAAAEAQQLPDVLAETI